MIKGTIVPVGSLESVSNCLEWNMDKSGKCREYHDNSIKSLNGECSEKLIYTLI